MSLLSEIRLSSGKNDFLTGDHTANIPAVITAAAAASGANLKLFEAFNLEVLSTSILSATVKSNHTGEIAGFTKIYSSIGGFQVNGGMMGIGGELGLQRVNGGEAFTDFFLMKSVGYLQQFVNCAERGELVDKSQFREKCSQATAFLLSNLVSDLILNPIVFLFMHFIFYY